MTETNTISGAEALRSLLGRENLLDAVSDREWAAAAGLIVKKLLISAGQTTQSLALVRASVGDDIFIPQLKSLTHHQARMLARRLDRNVPDFEVSSAPAAIAHVRLLLRAALPGQEIDPQADETDDGQDVWAATSTQLTSEEEAPAAGPLEDPSSQDLPERPAAPGGSSYFGRRSFRT